MGGSVEAHVLEEVGEALLLVVFENGANALGDVEISLSLGELVVADVIGHAVREPSYPYVGIGS